MTDTSHTVAPDESRHYVERLSLVLSDMGFPPMPARVWAALMTSETPSSTPGDLGSRLGVSPAAISGAVRYLQQVGLIERVAVPGSRRQHYCVSVDMWADAFVTKQSSLYQVSAVADEGIRVLGEGTTAGDRMEDLRDFFDFMAAEMPRMLADWRSQRKDRTPGR
ncbi:GbsR/MarR family transcriptional regulator [Rhodococcus erythropolis]|uniref:GbsR/MarR family transcriptional regulator n=1 Tax=Rhodococcus erythropolis TaxID=1833 RepID=UPI0037A79D61